jgi:hypothetical protein
MFHKIASGPAPVHRVGPAFNFSFGDSLNQASQTPHVPPKPIVTLPASTITGTCRVPREYSSMRFSAAPSFLTLKY